MSEPSDGTDETPGAGGSEPGDAPAEQGAAEPEREPGWYPDPDGSGWRRYWDGKAWATASAEELARAEPKRELPRRGTDGRRNLARAFVALVVVVVVAGVIIAASGSSTKRSHTASPVVLTTVRSLTPRTATPTSTATTTITTFTPVHVTAAAVTRALNAYVVAYNARSITALRSLFSPALIRRANNGAPQDLTRAMAVYRGQFSTEANPQLALAGVRVAPGAGHATAGAYFGVYAHNRRTRGTIAFHFVPSGSGLLIDQLNVHDHS